MNRKIRHELDQFRDETLAKAKAGFCEGLCDEHTGVTEAVRVFGAGGEDWGYFSYCEAARAEDTVHNGGCLSPSVQITVRTDKGRLDIAMTPEEAAAMKQQLAHCTARYDA